MPATAIPALGNSPGNGSSQKPAARRQAALALLAVFISIAVGWFSIAAQLDTSFNQITSHTAAGLNGPAQPVADGDDHDGCGPTPGCVLVVLHPPQLASLWSLMPLPGRLVPLNDALSAMHIPDPSGHVPIGRSARA